MVPRVRALNILLLLAALLATSTAARAGSVKVVKVLPHFLDAQGRMALNPSLYARDAYQLELRKHPELQSGLQFDVRWRGRGTGELKLRLELRGAQGTTTTTATLEKAVTHRGLFANWAKFQLTGEDWKKFGTLTAWRATLWSGDQQLTEQKSFLW